MRTRLLRRTVTFRIYKNADEVIITESEYDFELIKIGEQSFYDTLIKKLS